MLHIWLMLTSAVVILYHFPSCVQSSYNMEITLNARNTETVITSFVIDVSQKISDSYPGE
jgi:hypothetical protein